MTTTTTSTNYYKIIIGILSRSSTTLYTETRPPSIHTDQSVECAQILQREAAVSIQTIIIIIINFVFTPTSIK